MARRLSIAAALAIAAVACGRDPKDVPPTRKAPDPVAQRPVAPPPLRVFPTFITMEEIRAHTPSTPGLRMTTEVALDASGKQALGNGCVTAAGPKVAMHQIADAYGVARWDVKIRQTSRNDTQGELGADYAVYDGSIHVRGVLAASPACKDGEVGLALYYTKVAKAPRPPDPTPPPATDPLRRPATP
jgi:hypothetical protein